MKVVKCLVEICYAVITTQDTNLTTPIRSAEMNEHTNIAHYLKAQVMKIIMRIEYNIIPFYRGVRGIIIVKYLQ